MKEDLDKVKLLARDLRGSKEFPRSLRETLGGYVLAARAVDKCLAVLVGWQGEYHSNCPLDQRWLKFAEIDYHAYRSFVAAGATDAEVAAWVSLRSSSRKSRRASAQVPLKRFGTPEEIASAVLYLASSDSAFIVGTELVADGGMSQL